MKCKEQLDEKDADGHFIYDSYDLANNCIGSKASFALDILLNSINDGKHTFSNWKMPPYIEEGLLWLQTELKNQKELNQILQQIKMGHHFLLSGGAGSGKTFLLVEVLQSISSLVPSAHIACITYTNAAAIEIKNRASVKNLRVSTIHDFLWDSIAQFQKELKVTLLELINEPVK